MSKPPDLVQGTLDLLLLKILALEPMNGHADQPAAEAGLGRRAAGQRRLALSRPAQARAGRLAHRHVADHREQPAGEVLRAQPAGPTAARHGSREAGTRLVRRHHPRRQPHARVSAPGGGPCGSNAGSTRCPLRWRIAGPPPQRGAGSRTTKSTTTSRSRSRRRVAQRRRRTTRRAARSWRRFGGVEQSRRNAAAMPAACSTVDSLVQDLRYAARVASPQPRLRARRGADARARHRRQHRRLQSRGRRSSSRACPIAAPDRLVGINGTYPNGAFAALRDESRHARRRGLCRRPGVHAERLRRAGPRRRHARVGRALRHARRAARTRPMAAAGEDVAPRDRVVLLSHGLWMTRFNGDAATVGRFDRDRRRCPRDRRRCMPPRRSGSRPPRTQIWVPLGLDSRDTPRYWAGDFMPVIGRLRPGATDGAGVCRGAAVPVSCRTAVSVARCRRPGTRTSPSSRCRRHSSAAVRSRLLILIAAVASSS